MHRICAEGLFALLQRRSLGCCGNTLSPEWRHSRWEVSRQKKQEGRSARPHGRMGPGGRWAVSVTAFPRWAPEAGPPPAAQGPVGVPRDPGGKQPGLLPSDCLRRELGSCGGWILGQRAAPSSSRSFLVCKPGFSGGGGQLSRAACADG